MPTSRPSSFALASLSSRLELPITNAPASLATCTAAEPMPLPTELTSTVSPGRSRARVTSMCQAVPKAMWLAAASTSVTPSGMRTSCVVLAEHLLRVCAAGAHADEPGRRRTERLTAAAAIGAGAADGDQVRRHAVTELPALDAVAQRLDPSRPAPRRGCAGSSTGKRETPSRTSTSRWLSAVAVTSMTTSPAPATGSGQLLEPQDVGVAELVEDDCLHRTAPLLLATPDLCLCLTSTTLSTDVDPRAPPARSCSRPGATSARCRELSRRAPTR